MHEATENLKEKRKGSNKVKRIEKVAKKKKQKSDIQTIYIYSKSI